MSDGNRGPQRLSGAVEAGGTKILCAVGDSELGARETVRIPTRDVDTTTRDMLAFFDGARGRHGELSAVGLASFGPLDLDPASPTFGRITTTPKPGWSGADLRAEFASHLAVPVAIDTDVNAAALAEARLGAARGRKGVAYVTVGTGIGVGLLSDGRTVKGRGHPEAGHLIPRRHPAHDGFAGCCPFHGDCLEGLASGSAIMAAWGASLADLPKDHPAWDAQADYLGQLCAGLILTMAPEHIVIGGGVMAYDGLLAAVRAETLRRLGGYAALWLDPGEMAKRITGPGCAEPPGLLGAFLIAEALHDAG